MSPPVYTDAVCRCRLISDIGLIELESDVPFDDFTQPACLPSATNNSLPLADQATSSPYTDCTAIGWGRKTYNGKSRARVKAKR